MSDFKLTYATMFNPPEELHARFDDALAAVRANLGQEYGMLIDGAEVFAENKFKSTNTTSMAICAPPNNSNAGPE